MSSSCAFNTTCWTLILDAAKTCEIQSRPALESLCKTYWEPLYAYARSCGKTHQDAQDTTQAFFEHLLEKNLPGRVTPGLGRFRCFLLASLRNFMIAEHRNANCVKRGGEVGEHLSLEEARHLVATPSEAETAFDRQWAHTLIQLALDFKALVFSRFVDGRTLSVDVEAMIKHVCDKSSRHHLISADLREQMARLATTAIDDRHVCCGHDLVEILALALRGTIGPSSNGADADTLESTLRAGWQWHDLGATILYREVREWEASHRPFVIFGVIPVV